MHLSNSVSDEVGIVYIAKDLDYFEPEPDEDEVLTLKKIHISEAYEMVMNGEITDSLSVSGILKTKILIDNKQI